MLEQFFEYLLPCAINILTGLYIFSVITNVKINLKDYKMYIGFIVLLFLVILSYMFVNSFVRFLISTIFFVIGMLYIYKENFKRTFIGVVVEQTLMLFSEIIFTFLAIVVLGFDKNYLINEVKGTIITNMGISIICIILSNINFIKDKFSKLLSKFETISSKIVYILMLFVVFTMNILLILVYSDTNIILLLIINSIFIIIYTAIVMAALNEKSENIKFKQENEMLLGNLNEYEKMLDYQRVSNHENKNQLLVIRSMISKNNKKALDYLDEIITEKRKDDEGLYTYAKIIPEGGLQGLVYQKMLKMKENNIKINLNVDRKIRKVNFDSISSKVNYDLCRAVGIILDNAIEEVIKLKEKEVVVCMYKDEDYFVIEVSNKCEIIPDLSMMDEKGYTTKSEGHGYGLSLLKEIVSNNKSIINERKIDKDIFTQIIKIKM